MINIYEAGLSTEAFTHHYSFLETYFSKRNKLTLNKVNGNLLIKEIFETCSMAANLEKHNVPVCKHIITRFNKAWEIEGLRSSILTNKMKKTCETLKNSGKPCKICEAIKKLALFEDVENKNYTQTYSSSSVKVTTYAILNSFENRSFLENFFNNLEINLQEKIKKNEVNSAFCNGVSKELQEYWKHVDSYKQIADFAQLEKKNLSILDKNTNNQIFISYNNYSFSENTSQENNEIIKKTYNIIKTEKNSQNQKETDLTSKKIEIKTKKISYNKKLDNKTNESKLTESSLTLILISFFFKLAVAPFHLWSLDVYEGSLTSSTVFFCCL